MKDAQDLKIKRAIYAHEAYKNSWTEGRSAFSREMISPRGARHNYSSYCHEVNKHMTRTIAKIRKILEVQQ
jgi:hypothetical protein